MKTITVLLLACVSMGASAAGLTDAEKTASAMINPIIDEMYNGMWKECNDLDNDNSMERDLGIKIETTYEACESLYRARATIRLTKLGITRENARAMANGNTNIVREELVRLSGEYDEPSAFEKLLK